MSDDVDQTAVHLARNLRALRDAQSLTQVRLAAKAGIPRATLAHLETGAGNPTLGVVVRIAAALGVTIEELIGPPRHTGRVYRAHELGSRSRGGATITRLLPDPLPGLELERLEIPAGGAIKGVPHSPGTREYLFCERGRVELVASGDTYALDPGDAVVFRGDQRHSYRNPADEVAVAFSVVWLAPG
ncbi:MAG: XRE family transcriptional regulator [Myxococcota bacterium]